MPVLFRTCYRITEEKESHVRETMRIMGLSSASYWLSWFVYYLLLQLVIASICTALLVTQNVFVNSSPTIIWLVFFMFGIYSFGLIVLVQAFFTKPKNAGLMAVFLTGLNGLLNAFVLQDSTPRYAIKLATTMPTVCLIKISRTLNNQEAIGGSHLSNWDQEYYNFSVRQGIIYFAVQFIVLLVFGLYFDALNLSDVGAGKRPCFFFEWLRCSRVRDEPQSISDESNTQFETTYLNEGYYEPIDNTSLQRQSICISKLRKVFKSGLVAVDRINLRLCKDEIFVLLGHNGAGKTTLINMMAGMTQMSDGNINVMGFDVGNETDKVRQLIGICPQHDVLFEYLTPREHLNIFYELKRGEDGEAKVKEIDKLILDIGLADKEGALFKKLSGGNQRKLSAAIALCGGSQFVILDEPSSGLDIQARRELWTLLRKYRQNRVILLTTHYMDEADVLGHRIAVLKDGKVCALGSSIFLKSKLDCKYILKLAKETQECPGAREYVVSHMGSKVKLALETKRELTFQLPSVSLPRFGDFFQQLDRDMEGLGMKSYSISLATLTEVFTQLNENQVKHEDQENPQVDSVANPPIAEVSPVLPAARYSLAQKTERSFMKHFKAVTRKKCILCMRDKRSLVIELLVPSLLMILATSLSNVKMYEQSDPVVITTELLPKPQQILINSRPVFTSNSSSVVEADDMMIESELLPNFNLTDDIKFHLIDNFATFENFTDLVNDFGRTIDNPPNYGAYQVVKADRSTQQYQFVSYLNLTSQDVTAYYPQFMYQSLLKVATGDPELEFETTSWTFPANAELLHFQTEQSSTLVVGGTAIAFSIIITLIVGATVTDRVSGLKHYQQLCGMHIGAFWLANYIFDLFKLMFTIMISLVLFKMLDMQYDAAWLSFVLFTFAIVPFCYVLSFSFSDESGAQTFTFGINFFIMCLLTTTVQALRVIKSTWKVGDQLMLAMKVFPSYCLTQSIFTDGSNEGLAELRKQYGEDMDANLWSLTNISADCIALAIHAVVWPLLLIMIESDSAKRNCKRQKRIDIDNENQKDDSDVKAEASAVKKSTTGEFMIKVDELQKVYKSGIICSKPYVALEQLSFGVEKGECLTLLGVNGAGKTTTFKILTGQISPTSGSVQMGQLDVSKRFKKLSKLVGYCPQSSPIFDQLTVEEHLLYFAKLKCIPDAVIEEQICQQLKELDLEGNKTKKAGELSGGNKRKLAVAIALLGNPQIILLDEPTAGMDPQTRRFIWSFVQGLLVAKDRQSSVILTTHNVEEAEVLSTRVAVMLKGGKLRCIGSPQHLINKFAIGYIIEVKLDTERYNQQDIQLRQDSIIKDLVAAYGEVVLLENYNAYFKLRIGKKDIDVGQVFKLMEQLRSKFMIVYYSISLQSLESIFQTLADTAEDPVIKRFN